MEDDTQADPIVIPPAPSGRRHRHAARRPGAFQEGLEAVGPRSMFIGYAAAGVFLAWWAGMPSDSPLTWLAVAFWPLALFLRIASLMVQGFLMTAGTVAFMFAVPYVLGRVALSWSRSETRRRLLRVADAVRGRP